MLIFECAVVLLVLSSSNLAAAAAAPAATETQVLLDFKSGITSDPQGALSQWRNATSTSPSPCEWRGVGCDAQGRVISIGLRDQNLTGVVAAALLFSGGLPRLSSLDLSANSLSGPLPPSLPPALASLNLSFNRFSGPLPPSLCASSPSPSLSSLVLHNNSLSGPIPPSLSNCSSLSTLSLYFNRLSGTIPPQLGRLSRLRYLALSFNDFDGPIPVPILTNCTLLTTLALSSNRLTGPLPAEIGLLSSLQSLWLYHNQFSGPIPHEIGNLSKLTLLQMDTNNFTGFIPPSIGQLTSLSLVLSLSMNQLTGPVPPELGNLTNLTIMTLMGNSLNGSIPVELSKMKSLQGLFLEDNMLEGPIPSQLAACTGLQQLRLYNNFLNGTLPEALGSLQHLTELSVQNNMLAGGIPLAFSNLTAMQNLNLGNNRINGTIPDTVASLPTMTFSFSMPHNLLNGIIPPGIGQLIHVQSIDLSANNLSGTMPASIGNCVNLISLNLSQNSLTGSIPEAVSSLQGLESLDLSMNSLSGPIPAFLAGLPSLKYINLSYNKLSGPIPSSGIFAKLNATSFLFNPDLCGPPLSKPCPMLTYDAQSQNKSKLKVGYKVLIVLGSIFGLAICLFLLRYAFYHYSKWKVKEVSPLLSPAVSAYNRHIKQFLIRELECATQNFSEACIIGKGGSSKVYKATNLTLQLAPAIKQADAAIKVLSPDHEVCFTVELETLGSIRHRNLVRVYGYCSTIHIQALVLELVPNGSLQDHLHCQEPTKLSLPLRLQIALGVAKGLAYLHHGLRKQIVHRDVKPSNILLDQEMVAKLADFGIAKHVSSEEVHSKVKGTPGYVAPEYGESTRVDAKGDVYSFGIVMLEMLTRKQPTSSMFGNMGKSLPTWVRDAYPDRYGEIMDPELFGEDFIEEEEEEAMREMLEVALACVKAKAEQRPDMETVVTRLTAIETLLSPSAASTLVLSEGRKYKS